MLQLGEVNRLLLAELARRAPLLPGKSRGALADGEEGWRGPSPANKK